MRIIENVWFNKHPAKWVLVPLLLPFTALFWLISRLRRISFKLGLSTSYKLAKPVIVVGNIGVGGNGKTPVVIYLVALTRALGFTPGVISRGYGGKAPHYPYLVNEHSTALEAGDEPILIQQRCHVNIAVGSDRIASAELLIAQGCDIIISDDGLQHYRLQRDLEIIVVDAKRLFGNGLLLPAGPLREGKWRLPISDLVIYNGLQKKAKLPTKKDSESSTSTSASVQPIKKPSTLQMSLMATQVYNIKSGKSLSLSEFVSSNTTVNAVAGIGDPQRFFDTLLANRFLILQQLDFVDHHNFTLADFKDFDDNIPLLMTEKDAVKCHSFCQRHWWYLPVDADFSEDDKKRITEKVQALIA